MSKHRLDSCSCGNPKQEEARRCRPCADTSRRMTPEQKYANAVRRFWEKVDKRGPDECWPWLGSMHKANGYGSSPNAVLPGAYAHRNMYVITYGAIPDGLQVDHLCRNRACVNPAHLEAVTQQENIRRGAAAVTHCPYGHEYTAENTYLKAGRGRMCRACHRTRQSIRYHTKISPRARAAA